MGFADYTAFSEHAFAEEMRHRIKEVVSANGGHLSSNLGTVELTLALHRVFDFATDRLLWDVGHQAYPHKLLTGRARSFDTNRVRDGLSGFPDPQESPFDLAKVGHSSTGISTGVGVAEAYRRLGQKRRTVVVVGDGALTGGMSFEGLINAGQLKSDLIVVLNDNGNFIDAPVGSLHTHLDRIGKGERPHGIVGTRHDAKGFARRGKIEPLPSPGRVDHRLQRRDCAARERSEDDRVFPR